MSSIAAGSVRIAPQTPRLAMLALVVGALCIAFSPIFVKWSEAGPTATGFWRVTLSLPVLLLWSSAERGARRPAAKPRAPGDFALLAAAGFMFAGDLAAWHASLRFTNVANSTLFANLSPIFVTLGAWILFRQRITGLFLAGLICALAGAALMVAGSFSIGFATVGGDLLGLLTAVFYAGYFLVVSRLRESFGAGAVMFWSALVAALLLLPLAWVLGEPLTAATLAGWLVLLALAWVSHCGGQGLIAVALAHLPAPFSAVTLLVQPVAAGILAWLLLGEQLTAWQIVGGLVVLAGIFLAARGRG